MSVELFQAVRRFSRRFPKVVRVSRLSANSVSRWWQQMMTEQELRWLSDRDLADIGVARRDIGSIARACVNASAKPQKDPTLIPLKSKPACAYHPLENIIAFQEENCEAADVPQEARKIRRRGVKGATRPRVRPRKNYQSHSP